MGTQETGTFYVDTHKEMNVSLCSHHSIVQENIRATKNFSYQGVAEVLGGGTVGVGGLDNTDRDIVNASRLDKVDNVHGSESSNLVSVQQLEGVVYITTSKASWVSFPFCDQKCFWS